jgi:glutathionyl-hydroquinone reductase
MGVLIEGRWTDGELSQQTIRSGACELSRQLCSATPSRPTARPASRRSRDANVHLAHGCPWWHRILIYRALKKLAKSSPSPTPYRVSSRPAGRSNAMAVIPTDCVPDEVNGFHRLDEAHVASNLTSARLRFRRRGTRKRSSTTNRPRSSCSMPGSTRSPATALISIRQPLPETDTLNKRVCQNVDSGYRAGFAKMQGD